MSTEGSSLFSPTYRLFLYLVLSKLPETHVNGEAVDDKDETGGHGVQVLVQPLTSYETLHESSKPSAFVSSFGKQI